MRTLCDVAVEWAKSQVKVTRLKSARIYPPVGILHGTKDGGPVLRGQASWRTVSGFYVNSDRTGFVSVEVRNFVRS